MNDDAGGRRTVRRMRWPRTGLLAIVAGTALLTAACSGSASAPHVASLGTSSGTGSGSSAATGSSTSTVANGNPTQLLDEWAACIRGHGDPNQADPTINADKDIEITMDNVPKPLEDEVHGSTGPCSSYLLAAENTLRGGQPAPSEDSVTAVKEAQCIRASGFPTYPDPSANGETNLNGTGIDANSQALQNATKACDKKLGIPYYGNGTAPPGVVQVTGCNAPPGVKCPKGGPGTGGGGAPRPASSGSGG
jgi:hypothetical protein